MSSNILADLTNATQEHVGACKICSYLAMLPAEEAEGADRLIRAKESGRNKISAARVAAILKANGASAGASTVSRHRTTCAPILES